MHTGGGPLWLQTSELLNKIGFLKVFGGREGEQSAISQQHPYFVRSMQRRGCACIHFFFFLKLISPEDEKLERKQYKLINNTINHFIRAMVVRSWAKMTEIVCAVAVAMLVGILQGYHRFWGG